MNSAIKLHHIYLIRITISNSFSTQRRLVKHHIVRLALLFHYLSKEYVRRSKFHTLMTLVE